MCKHLYGRFRSEVLFLRNICCDYICNVMCFRSEVLFLRNICCDYICNVMYFNLI